MLSSAGIGLVYVAGIISFALLLNPLTDPALYGSWFHTLFDRVARTLTH
jgi:hypothetical protein